MKRSWVKYLLVKNHFKQVNGLLTGYVFYPKNMVKNNEHKS